MEENCGNSQVAVGAASVSSGIPQGMMASGSSQFPSDGNASVSMPICFLIREQAKSLVAIQELQKRMQHIEGVQEEVVTAIHDVNDYITVGADGHPISLVNRTSTKSPLFKESTDPLPPGLDKSFLAKNPKNMQKCLAEDPKCIGNKDSAPESDKQDSGLDSDCRESHPLTESQCPYLMSTPMRNKPDELLDLLDEIGEKSVILTQHVSSGVEENKDLSVTPNLIRQEMAAFRQELQETFDLMRDFCKERDMVNRSWQLDCATRRLAIENSHGNKSVHFNAFTLSKVSKESTHKVDPEVVSSVLKESSVTNLQKQVLTSMMENEVMRSKLNQVDELLAAKSMEKDFMEKLYQEEISHLTEENTKLGQSFDELQMENASLTCRVRMLEKVVQTMTVENRDLSAHLGETVVKSSSKFSSPSFCASKRSTVSAKEVTCARSKLLTNTSSFIDVSLQDVEEEDMGVPLFESAGGRSSTPLPTAERRDKTTRFRTPLASSSGNVTTVARKPNRRLTFNSIKTLTSPETYRNKAQQNPIACDHSTTDLSQRLAEKTGSSEFPFYTILQKLKESSDYKLTRQDCQLRDSPTKCPNKCSSSKVESVHKPCSHRDDGTAHKKNGTKTINKRIQDILDRITTESESSSAV